MISLETLELVIVQQPVELFHMHSNLQAATVRLKVEDTKFGGFIHELLHTSHKHTHTHSFLAAEEFHTSQCAPVFHCMKIAVTIPHSNPKMS